MIQNRLLFYGPKGCGKSYFAECFFGELEKLVLGWMTVELKKSAILRDPNRNIEKAFAGVKRFEIRGVLIEDFDSLLDDLTDFKSARRNLLENIKAISGKQILIATTRHPNSIDDKILLDFDDIIPFYYQNKKGRLDILRVHSKIIRDIEFDKSVDLNEIAGQTEWFSGEELEDLIILAQKKSNTNIVSKEDILDTSVTIRDRIIVENRINEVKRLLHFTLKYCTLKPARDELIDYAKNLKIDLSEQAKGDKLDWNKVIELKPNFFGFGVNLNELINRFKGYFGKVSQK
ncbi:hypothetical protein ES702_00957 [subsurface metagenome]